jgi:hypothetical protein
LVRRRAAVANTIGVRRTTVASRLRTAVVAAANEEHHGQQPPRLPSRADRHPHPQRVEHHGPPAAVGQHKQRGEKPNGRAELTERLARTLHADDPDDH